MTRKLMLVALIALVLCTGLGAKVSCTAPATEWRLTVKSTEGGSVTTPGEGVFWYNAGEVVVLAAVPEPGYRFVKWTGRVYTMSSTWIATASITMDLDYTITANFAPLHESPPVGITM